MKLGTKARYAVMGMVDLTLHETGFPVALSAIAARQEISVPYLEQLFNKLKSRGLIASVRGAAGGYVLGRPASQITVADIIIAVGEPLHATRCDPKSAHGCLTQGATCVVHHLWDKLSQQIYGYLESVTLEDLRAPSTILQVCHDHA